MARFLCKCGETLSNSLAPNDIELKLYTDMEWDEIINQEVIDPLAIPEPKYDVWRCPKCERLYFFENGKDEAIKVYKLEEN
jgi:hypothetical protein